jgi:hypothetical protein
MLFLAVINSSNAQLPATIDLSNLNGFNGFKFEASSSDYFGGSVSSIGDINGDGIDDIAIGDTTADTLNTDDGAVYVIFGKSDSFQSQLNIDSLNGSNGLAFIGEQAFGQAGWSVNPAGDFNDDGIDDLIIGALTVDNNQTLGTGAIYVIYGNSTGFNHPFNLANLNGNNGFKAYGVSQFDFLGRSASTIGDINNDNIDDVIACSTDKSVGNLSQAGSCYVIFGSASTSSPFDLTTLNGTNGFIIESSIANEQLGYKSGFAGDFNDDGIDDLYVNGVGTEKAYIIYGQSTLFQAELNLSNLNGVNGFAITETGESTHAISYAGDFNHDGISDMVLGKPELNNFTGSAFVLFGDNTWPQTFSLNNFNSSNGITINGINENDFTGLSVSNAGDINGDGITDLVISSPSLNQNTSKTYIIYGSKELPININVLDLDGENGLTIITDFLIHTFPVSSAGDISADGISDVLIGAPDINRSYVVIGNDVIFVNAFE